MRIPYISIILIIRRMYRDRIGIEGKETLRNMVNRVVDERDLDIQ